jgi:hypothetical protein
MRRQQRWQHTSKGDEINDAGNTATGNNDDDNGDATGKDLNNDRLLVSK